MEKKQVHSLQKEQSKKKNRNIKEYIIQVSCVVC